MPILRQGSTGEEVKRLQHLLNTILKPSPNLQLVGKFGPKTDNAVRRFQKLSGLKVDGQVGPKTWTALQQLSSSKPVASASAPKNSWMEIAKAELGVHENAQKGLHNKRIVEYHSTTTLKATTDEIAWCSSFVNWVMQQAGYKGTKSALAKSWLDWGGDVPAGRYGAITVIKKKGKTSDVATGSTTGFHVGFFESLSTTHIRLLGGNQSDQVKSSGFNLGSYEVRGYRWPG